jgi:hypothetical protein
MTKLLDKALGSDGDHSQGSTGPRTLEGKRRSKRNAIRHGIFASLVLTAEPFQESIQDFDRLLKDLRKALEPTNALEHTLVEILAFELLRLSRLYKADARIAPIMFEKVHTALIKSGPHVFTECVDKEREHVFVQQPLDPELLIRYGSSVTKHIHRLLERFDRR